MLSRVFTLLQLLYFSLVFIVDHGGMAQAMGAEPPEESVEVATAGVFGEGVLRWIRWSWTLEMEVTLG